ncbi:MAG: phenylacetate-CoA oxygenase subunit PaaJ [Acidimicrobiales bacterium]|nr:phenylacetate-CoA oxygenase subunit PaaJ [Acidimicrobiia bacterium]NNC79549.1 phenylacetate-CoA oxygenase subunit PaaJ [Acidimicrobiales bacterium]
MVTMSTMDLDALRAKIAEIPDPEVPVLTIEDLGVLRRVEERNGNVVVTITPTYSGCPAMHHIEQSIRTALNDAGVEGDVETVFSPAWTTEWVSDEGKAKLRDYGIAPPRHIESAVSITNVPVRCPQCNSARTEVISTFGSTACKSLWRCLDCLEPFDHFKEL